MTVFDPPTIWSDDLPINDRTNSCWVAPATMPSAKIGPCATISEMVALPFIADFKIREMEMDVPPYMHHGPSQSIATSFCLLLATAGAGNGQAQAPRIYPGGEPLQAMIDSLPDSGGTILIAPGVYREKLVIGSPNVVLRGTGKSPDAVHLVWDDSAASAGGTAKSASVTVRGESFTAENLTIRNDYSKKTGNPPSQAVALHVSGDKAVFRNIRLIGAQDTLFAGGRTCDKSGRCSGHRQYFENCYIEGHVDFIFGEGRSWFQDCQLHAIAAPQVMITAQSRNGPDWLSAYVFDRARITVDPAAGEVWLGRPWRPFATVIFRNSWMDAGLHPAGWREWTPGKVEALQTAYYAEYRSRGPGARATSRTPFARQLTRAEAERWTRERLFDGWDPGRRRR